MDFFEMHAENVTLTPTTIFL